jgi:hypothetical protein
MSLRQQSRFGAYVRRYGIPYLTLVAQNHDLETMP